MNHPSRPICATVSILAAACFLTAGSCALKSPANSFRVLPATPAYLLRSPDAEQVPFPEILRMYNGFEPGHDWMDLRPQMELRIENAYYRAGMSRRGLDGYLGTEIARYKVRSGEGLQLLSIQSMKDRPAEQPPIQQLIGTFGEHYKFYRFYYEIFFHGSGNVRGSVLIGANTRNEMNRLSNDLLTNPESVCGERSRNCTVFPEACSVSIEMEIIVNGKARNVIWGSLLSEVVGSHHLVELSRIYNGRLLPVKIDAGDVEALRLPLLPGDHARTRGD